jgi:hypothetical protein
LFVEFDVVCLKEGAEFGLKGAGAQSAGFVALKRMLMWSATELVG